MPREHKLSTSLSGASRVGRLRDDARMTDQTVPRLSLELPAEPVPTLVRLPTGWHLRRPGARSEADVAWSLIGEESQDVVGPLIDDPDYATAERPRQSRGGLAAALSVPVEVIDRYQMGRERAAG